MTEEEANTKWCPMVAIASPVKTEEKVAFSNCIASDCMMWQWDYESCGSDGEIIADGHCGLTK